MGKKVYIVMIGGVEFSVEATSHREAMGEAAVDFVVNQLNTSLSVREDVF